MRTIRSFASQSSDHRSKVLHLRAAIHRNVGESVAFPLLKKMLHRLPGTHHDAWNRWVVSLGVPIGVAIIDSKYIGQLTEFEAREALARGFAHPRQLLFQAFVIRIDALCG